MDCTEVKYYLNDFSKGILLDEMRAEIHEHINNCSNCAKALDEIITLRSKAGLKHRFVNKQNRVRAKIHKNMEENNSSREITPKAFPTISSLTLDADHLKNNLIMKANDFTNNKLLVITGIISTIALGIILAFIIFDHSPAEFWPIEKVSGRPVIETKVLTGDGAIESGERLFTDFSSRARLKLENIGEIDIEPQSEIRIIESGKAEHKLILSRGRILARSWSIPKLFSIKTPSANIKDLGCAYSITVDEKSSTFLNVTSGWVLMENKNCKSLLPKGTSCYSGVSGMGTPFSESASLTFKDALYNLDFNNGSSSDLDIVLSEARKDDLITLFHLLKRSEKQSREKIFNRIAELFTIPQRITPEGIIQGNNEMMARLWVELGLGSISIYQNL
ncbi:MAG: FecR domain-containing protein [Ignavibacteriaceae bacterium]|nr:FecR domain-containing protein [Ignavibacteriaceae bacterium]